MRYQEVYNLAKQGYSYQQIADKMGITLKPYTSITTDANMNPERKCHIEVKT